MLTNPDFSVTEAGMRACVETMHALHQAVAVAQAQIEALGEAFVMFDARLELLEENARSCACGVR